MADGPSVEAHRRADSADGLLRRAGVEIRRRRRRSRLDRCAALILVPRFDAATVLAAVTEHRATMMDGVPTAYHYLLAHPDVDRADLSSLSGCSRARTSSSSPARP